MHNEITWTEPPMVALRSGMGPAFAEDDGFNPIWWRRGVNFGPPAYQWRSYAWRGEEVARMLVSCRYSSHLPSNLPTALMIWSFEVREDLRCGGDHIGTRIIEQFAEESADQEIYIASASESMSFWTRFGWPMCECESCFGRDFIVRRP